ncbi:hypothetical protein GWK47_039590 [Chionoecetes opilio]|uniref:Uncharacterized protein n=1 Tax=Chionoecetes opilio TaxID=41210 RepID=A0A8J5D0B0_CHIOP|nr:hypothetical protein GWK47_039590 [Chionoecetes opilio]
MNLCPLWDGPEHTRKTHEQPAATAAHRRAGDPDKKLATVSPFWRGRFVTFMHQPAFFAHLQHESVFHVSGLSSRKVGCAGLLVTFQDMHTTAAEQKAEKRPVEIAWCLRRSGRRGFWSSNGRFLPSTSPLLLRADAVHRRWRSPSQGSLKGPERWRAMAHVPRPDAKPHRRKSLHVSDEVQVFLAA